MREQVCIYMCPYARFQSAMFDKDTLIVSYDERRGEPRGSRKRNANVQGMGDCIDCQLCVQVCPVGIDIRDGLQYQCIGCAHCVDACNQVMDKMGYARNLVGYTTEHALSGGQTHWLRGRAVGYAAVLVVMCVAFSIALFNRSAFEVDVIRERGALYQTTADGAVSNQYRLRVLNKTQHPQSYTLTLTSDLPLEVTREVQLTEQLSTLPGELQDLPLTLTTPTDAISGPSTPVTITLCDSDNRCDSERSTFFGPAS